MISVGIALALGAQVAATWRPFTVQFVGHVRGENVQIRLDGRTVKRTFAGKLAIRDRRTTVYSVCGNVRGPVGNGQFFNVKPMKSSSDSRLALAGSIVTNCFEVARTDAQCAGLQLAVWEAMEDGGRSADFQGGRFQANGSKEALAWAEAFYDEQKAGEALFLWTGDGGGQSQFLPGLIALPER